jgi:hypothetical protein
MNKMTWLDLYSFLYKQANDTKNFGNFDWQSPVIIHDASTGDECDCDTWVLSCDGGKDKIVLATNIESIFNENNKGGS